MPKSLSQHFQDEPEDEEEEAVLGTKQESSSLRDAFQGMHTVDKQLDDLMNTDLYKNSNKIVSPVSSVTSRDTVDVEGLRRELANVELEPREPPVVSGKRNIEEKNGGARSNNAATQGFHHPPPPKRRTRLLATGDDDVSLGTTESEPSWLNFDNQSTKHYNNDPLAPKGEEEEEEEERQLQSLEEGTGQRRQWTGRSEWTKEHFDSLLETAIKDRIMGVSPEEDVDPRYMKAVKVVLGCNCMLIVWAVVMIIVLVNRKFVLTV